MKKNLILIALLCSIHTKAQLPNGSIAPDFTFVDVEGDTQHLYSYLDQGLTVYLDIFAAHCPTCWAYHNTYHLKDLYEQHGPNGSITQDVMVIALEHDPNNDTLEIYGHSGNTQGNWDAGYPIINPEGADRVQFITDYSATYYPMIYAICPNRIITLMGTVSSSQLYSHVALCPTIGITEPTDNSPYVYYDGLNALKFTHLEGVNTLEIYNTSGQLLKSTSISSSSGTIAVDELSNGLFIFYLYSSAYKITGKFIR